MRKGGKREKRKKGRERRRPSKAELLKKERSWSVGSGRNSLGRRVFFKKKGGRRGKGE